MPPTARAALRGLTPAALLLLLLLSGLPRLQPAFTYRAWFHADDPHLLAFQEFQQTFGNDDVLACVVHRREGLFDPQGAKLLGEVTDALLDLQDVERVSSLSTFDWIHDKEGELRVDALLPAGATAAVLDRRAEIARRHEIPQGYLVSQDLKTALVFARLSAVAPEEQERSSREYGLILAQAEAALSPIRARLGPKDELALAGSAVIPVTLQKVTQADMKRVVPLLLCVLIVVLGFLFRSVLAVALTLVVLAATTLVTFGVAGWTGIPLNPLTLMVPPILIAIGVADCVHLLATYRMQRLAGECAADAARTSLEKNLVPTFVTSFSTALGFVSLAFSDLVPIGQLGILAAVGTMAAWLLAVGLLPPVLGSRFMGEIRAAPPRSDAPQGRLSERAVALLARGRWPIVLVSALTLVSAFALASRNEVNSDTLEYFGEDVPLKRTTLLIKNQVGGVTGVDLSCDSGATDGALEPEFLNKVVALQEWLRALPKVTKVLSMADLVRDTHRAWYENRDAYYRIPDTAPGVAQALASYTLATPNKGEIDAWLDEDKRRVRLNVLWTLSGSKYTAARVEAIRAKAKELGLDADVTGKTVLMTGMNKAIVSTYFSSILAALVLVSLLMIVLLRSLGLGALAMLPNVMAPACGAALIAAIGQPIDIGTVLVSSVCLGIAVDDTIHFLISYQRQRAEGANVHAALVHVFQNTAPALMATTIVLGLSFLTFSIASFTPNVHFGVLTVVVMVFALAADLVLLPAILLCLGREVTPTPAP